MLQQLKQEHGVMQRWKPDDAPFQLARDEANDRQKRACLQKIYAKVVERWFLLSLKAKYAGIAFTLQKIIRLLPSQWYILIQSTNQHLIIIILKVHNISNVGKFEPVTYMYLILVEWFFFSFETLNFSKNKWTHQHF